MIDADLSHVSVRYKTNNMTVELLLYLCHCFNLVLAEENSANKTSFKTLAICIALYNNVA